MQTIREWESRRSGATMTISGKDPEGDSVIITGVVKVKGGQYAGPESGHVAVPVATTKDGDTWALV